MSKKRKPETPPPDKPLEPQFWFIVGGLILVVAGCIYFDPIGFAEAGQSQNSTLQAVLVMVVAIFGKNPTAIILTALALLSFGWGIRAWLQKRSNSQ